MYTIIDWDPKKAARNQQKHGVAFEEAASVFQDEFATQYFDDDHSKTEDRFVLLGMSDLLRILVVCHCERDDGRTIRIISARKATPRERSFYRGLM